MVIIDWGKIKKQLSHIPHKGIVLEGIKALPMTISVSRKKRIPPNKIFLRYKIEKEFQKNYL